MYTAIYSRVSTGMQASEGTSLDAQVEICIRKARDMGLSEKMLKVYREEGFTGEDIDRPAMNDLRQDVAQGIINRLIVTHPDRLTRDLTDKLILCRELERSDVEIIFVDTEYRNTPEGQLFFNLMSSIAQYELSLIKKRTVRGRLKAVEKEKKIMPMRTAPYGYDLSGHTLVINEEEAEFVRKMYHWYVYDHYTLREIGERLYSLGAVPKRGESRNWSASSIRRVLTSEVYIGRFYYNRRETRKIRGEKTKNGNPKKTVTFRDENDWILVEVPPIIDPQVFALAQSRREKNKKKSGNVKYDYLLKSMIRCGHCGRMWQATTYSGRTHKETGEKIRYTCYRCPNKTPKRYGEGVEKCPTRTLRADMLDDFVWRLVLETLSNPADYIERLQNRSTELHMELQSAAENIKRQIEQKEKEKEKIKLMFKREVIDEQEMLNEMRHINAGLTSLKQELSGYEKQLSEVLERKLSATQAAQLTQTIRTFVESGGDQLSFADKRHIVETLVDEILIRFDGDEVQVTAVGALDELKRQQFLSSGNGIELCSHPQKV
ncbi:MULTISPECIES: recombinase family protein [Bacillales]|uniref:recombinase family protein n=1 Tax=Brevibacillus TaxID=55080 RepID=UPI001492A26A|nr:MULTISPECIES: recombinase family protein [Bacillales]NNV02526.1 recombinase family protein [Brevibacillus sp. MCWH]UFJ60048.1 recombinase family protein [Anoxybacillus sediminis]